MSVDQLDTKQFHEYLISKNYVITLNDIEDRFKIFNLDIRMPPDF